MPRLVQINFQDGLLFPSGALNRATYRCCIYASVPDAWLADGKLSKQNQEKFLQHMYGPTWRLGNDDGSAYFVTDISSQPLTAEEIEAKIWLTRKSSDTVKNWFWHLDENGKVTDVKPDEL